MVIDICNIYAWVVPLKDKKGTTIVNAFQNILDFSKRKSNKIWVYQDSEFYHKSFKKWLEDNDKKMYSTYNDIKMYSTNNEGKSVVAERFIRTLKNNIQ